MSSKPVDTAIVMVVGPCIDDTDFKSLEEAIAWNAAGMDVSLIVEKTDGTTAVTAIALTTGGVNDWTHTDGGYYSVEITAAQNTEEGVGFVRGICDGVLVFESPRYDIEVANIYDSLRKGTDKLQIDLTQIGGVAATDTHDLIERILGMSQEDFYIDNPVFTDGKMTSCRVRTYSVSGSVGTASDVIATYTMTTTYNGDNLATYKMVKA